MWYKASTRDIDTIQLALDFVWRRELDHIFSDKDRVARTLVLAFDGDAIYVWRLHNEQDENYCLHVFPHGLPLNDVVPFGWCCGPYFRQIEQVLPKKLRLPEKDLSFISGVFLTQYLEYQSSKDELLNPYTTYESYLATIVHEFGHAYYNQAVLGHWLNKAYNLASLAHALEQYSGRLTSVGLPVIIPVNPNLSEIFAFCTDYTASSIFWPEHRQNLDLVYQAIITELINEETRREPLWEIPKFETPHLSACVFGPLVMNTFGDNWPRVLLSFQKHSLQS